MPDAQPIFTKRDPTTGAVLFDFSGHIHASGLDLDVADNTFGPVNAVEWIRTAAQSNPGTVGAFESGIRELFAGVEGNALSSRAFSADGTGNTAAQLQTGVATRNAGGGIATDMALFAAIHDPTAASGLNSLRVVVDRDAGAGAVSAVILDSALRSSFVQAPGLSQLRLIGGGASLFFPGSNSSTGSLAHGLGVTPIAAVCVGQGFNFLGSIQSMDASNISFGFQVVNPPGGTFGPGNMTFYWLAIG